MPARVIWNGAGVGRQIREAAAAGLNSAAAELLEEALPLTPKLTDALEDSASVFKANSDHLAAQVQYAKYYSVYQHEDLSYRHDNGEQAKFLESPLRQNASRLAEEVVKAILAVQ